MCGWEGVGALSLIGDHILLEFNTLYLTRFRTYKFARPPQKKQKPRRGGDLRQKNTYRKVPLQVNFMDETFCCGVYIVNCSMLRAVGTTDQRIHWIGHRGEGPSHAGQLRTVCILS